MKKKVLTLEQKKADIDLWIIIITALVALAIYSFFQAPITTYAKDPSSPILLRVLLAASSQFAVAGLGIVIVMLYRKEGFTTYDLTKEGALKSIIFSSLCFVPHIAFLGATNQLTSYLPFQSVWTTKDILASGFPSNIIGYLMTATAWGFFEGFNYVVISDKINQRYPSSSRWLNWGAISCAILCILIHGAVGVTPDGITEMITVFIIVYGMLMVRKITTNGWGCVFVFLFLWNAF